MPTLVAAIEIPGWSVALPLLLGLITLWVNGDRAERTRRQALNSRALEAVLAYREMPFMIRRRRFELEERSSERVRLATQFSEVQSELAACQHLVGANGPRWLAAAYEELVDVARATAGEESQSAWAEEPISTDPEMSMPDLLARLGPLNRALDRFESEIDWAGRSRRGRRFRWGPPPKGQRPNEMSALS